MLHVLALHSPPSLKGPGTSLSPVFPDSIPDAAGLWFSGFWCLPPCWRVGLEASERLPGGRGRAGPLVGGAGS